MSDLKQPEYIQYLLFNLGYAETTTPSFYAYCNYDGFISIYEMLSDFSSMLYSFYKYEKRIDDSGQSICYKGNDCPTKNSAYPYDYCHSCGKKTKLSSSLDNVLDVIDRQINSVCGIDFNDFGWTADFHLEDLFLLQNNKSIVYLKPDMDTLKYIMSFLERPDVHPGIKKELSEIAKDREQPGKFWLNQS